jgi:type II secretory pathway predicted ATPase ExeA
MADLHRLPIQPSERCGISGAARPQRVYMDFFRFRCPPFAITPDPEFLFLSATHQNAIEKIQYGIRTCQGFMLLTGEVGTGKSTLCRVILDLLQDKAQTVYVINPSLSTEELFATILDDLGAARSERNSKKALIDRLNAFLLSRAAGQPVVIIIDDAQGMSPETLEDMRLLSNLETDKDKLLQVLLVGQPELRRQIEAPRMRQLRQRIAVNCCLDFLGVDEVGRYIERRLFIAGNHGQVRFTPRLGKQIHKVSQGIPRLINKVCDLVLTAAYAADSAVVDTSHLKAARHEMIELGAIPGRGKAKIPHIWTGLLKAAVSLACLAAVIFYGAEAYVMLNRAEAPEAHATVSTPPDAPVAKVDTPMAFPQAVDQAGGYILQLGSYKSLETTLRAVDIYAQKQIDAYWAYLPGDDAIIWYRVFAGRFASHQQAQDYQKTHALSKAVVKFAPWTVAVGELGSKVQIGALRDLLKVHRLDGYEVPCKDGRWYLLSGAFLSRDGAEALSDQIRQYTGLTTRIANLGGRRPLEALHQPTNEDRHSS